MSSTAASNFGSQAGVSRRSWASPGARLQVYEAATNRLRVELFGGGSVVQMEFPAGGGPAMVAVMLDARFERK